jgi:uncharacterized protein DUF6916
MNSMLENFHQDTFAAHLNGKFKIELDAATQLELELIRITQPSLIPQGTECFSLVFRGPLLPAIPQRTYPVQHPELGSFQLFLVPVGIETEGRIYESVFNRILKK